MNPQASQQSLNIGPMIQALGPLLSLFPATAPVAPFVMAGGTLLNGLNSVNQKPYVPTTASPGMGFAMGGSLETLTDGALKVEGNPQQVDSVQAPMANLDDGEVVYGNFVFSRRLTNVQTGRPFSEDAENIVRKIAKLRKSKGNMDARTAHKLEMMLGKLALEQEKAKQILLQQQAQQQMQQQPQQQMQQPGMAFGGPVHNPLKPLPSRMPQQVSSINPSNLSAAAISNLITLQGNPVTLPVVTVNSTQQYGVPYHPNLVFPAQAPPHVAALQAVLSGIPTSTPNPLVSGTPIPFRHSTPPHLRVALPAYVSSVKPNSYAAKAFSSLMQHYNKMRNKPESSKTASTKYTDADKIQALALLSSALPLLRGPEREPLVLDRSTYTRDQLDPRAALQASSRLVQGGMQNASSSVSPFVRQALINSVLSTGLASQSQILDDYRRNNLQALRTFEAQVSKTEQDNVRSRLVNLEANAQNRAAYINDMHNFLQSIVNFSSQLNQRKSAEDYFDMLKKAYAHLHLFDDGN